MNKRKRSSDDPWVMLVLLLLTFGPLALPALWSGKAFGTRGKLLLTVLTALQVVLIVWMIKAILIPQVQELYSTFHEVWR